MKTKEQNKKLKRGTCVTLALLIAMTAITAMTCVPSAASAYLVISQETPVATETQPEQKEITTDEGYNYLFVEGGKVNEDGSIAVDISQLDLEEGLNLISFSDPMSDEDLNIGFEDTETESTDFNGFKHIFVDDYKVNEDGTITIDISDNDLEEDLNFINNDINYIFADNFKVNEDGTIAIDISDLDLKEGLNLISFCDSMSGEETIDPEFSYTSSDDEVVDEEMFV